MRFSFLGKGKPFWSQVRKTNVLPHIASIQANFYCDVTFFPVLETNYFFILSQNICEAHAACAQEGQTEVRDMTIEGSCA